MAVTIRNIDGSTPWVNTTNPNSVRIAYDNGTTEAGTTLEAVDQWLCGFNVSAVTNTTVVVSVTIPTVPSTGTLKLYDASTSLSLSIAYSSYTGSTFTVSGLTAALAGVSGMALDDMLLDKCAISGGYGDKGWNPVGTSAYFVAATSVAGDAWNGSGDTQVRTTQVIASSTTVSTVGHPAGSATSYIIYYNGTNYVRAAYSAFAASPYQGFTVTALPAAGVPNGAKIYVCHNISLTSAAASGTYNGTGDFQVVTNEALTGCPESGQLFIDDLMYHYTSWSGTTFNITTALPSDLTTNTVVSVLHHPLLRSYKALNVGGAAGVTQTAGSIGGYVANYKWMVMDVATAPSFFIKCYEWVTGISGTSLAGFSATAILAQRFNNTASVGSVYISASARHLVMLSVYGANVVGCSTGNGCSGIVEYKPTHPSNTIATGITPYGFIAAGYHNQVGNSAVLLYAPRTVHNAVAAQYNTGYVTTMYAAGVLGTTNLVPAVPTLDSFTNKYRVSDIILYQSNSSGSSGVTVMVCGPLYTMKIVAVGTYLDEVNVLVDSNYFVDTAGSSKSHLIMPGVHANNTVGAYMFAVPK